jgi:hypothetical protein
MFLEKESAAHNSSNFWMPEMILTKFALYVVSLMDISMEPIQFLNFEKCVQNKFLKFDFKAISLTK